MQLVIDEKVLSVQTTMGEGIMIMMITQLQDQLRSDILETGKKKSGNPLESKLSYVGISEKSFHFCIYFTQKITVLTVLSYLTCLRKTLNIISVME